MPNINWSTTGAMNRPVTCGFPVAKVLSTGFGTTAFGKGLPKGTKVLTSCCMWRSMSTMLPRCCNASEASAWRWNSAKSPWPNGGKRPRALGRAVERVDAAQVGEQGERLHEAGKAPESGGGEVIPFEAAERERSARERERHRHPVYHRKPGLGSRRRSSRHQQAVQAVDAGIDTESIEQIEQSDGGHREANYEPKARVLAAVY